MEYATVKQLISDAQNETDLFEARTSLNKFKVEGGDTVQVCKLYQQLKNKSRKLVNTKVLTR